MDIQRLDVPSPRVRTMRRLGASAAIIVAIVFGVASLPVLFLYFTLPRAEPSGERPARALAPLDLPAAEDLAFVDVGVLGDRGIEPHRTVIVHDGRILRVDAAEAASLPLGIRRIPGAGRVLVAGLTDAHVHFGRNEADNAVMLRLLLESGVTTAVNLKGGPSQLALRQAVADGRLAGPTVYTSGPFISAGPPSPPPTADEAERAVLEQKRAGYDLVKIHGDFPLDAYQRTIRTAHRVGLRVVGHAPRNLGIQAVFDEHQDALAHAEEYIYAAYRFDGRDPGPLAIEAMTKDLAAATAASGLQVVANLTAYKGIWQQAQDVEPLLARPEVARLPPSITFDWMPERNTYVRRFGGNPAPFARWYAVLLRLTAALARAGVPILTGTDTPIPCVVPGTSIHDELDELVAAGLTPLDAIRAATSAPARFLGREREFGRIAEGLRADLILVDGDPLDDLSRLRRPLGVMVRGRWLDMGRRR